MRRVLGLTCVIFGALGVSSAAAASGPPLSVPAAALERSVRCEGFPSTAPPVLLVPGTTLTPREFAWNWMRALRLEGRPFCTVELPADALGDAQVAAEHIVYAIRRESSLAGGRRVQVVGHSQGGMLPRWALKFWPDTRALVDDLVGLAPSNHGSLDADGLCTLPGACAPAIWQQRTGSAFLRALNRGDETFAGIDYTVVYTRLDEVVTPNLDAATGSSALRTGAGRRTNVALQDVCPLSGGEHLAIGTYDAVAWALAWDALTHDGPADPRRVSRGVCARAFMPGVRPSRFLTDDLELGGDVARALATGPRVRAEPPLAPYAR